MSLVELLVLLFVAGVCGAIGQAIAGFSRGGCIVSIVVGFIGAVLGMWIARRMNLPEPFVVTIDSTTFPVLWAIVGSALFVALISLLSRGDR